MELKEFLSALQTAEDKDWWESKETIIELPHLNIRVSFKGIGDAYKSIHKQVELWSQIKSEFGPIKSSKENFTQLQEGFVEMLERTKQAGNQLDHFYRSIITPLLNNFHKKQLFLAGRAELNFLIEIEKSENGSTLQGAYSFFVNANNPITRFGNRDVLKGFIMAYEYDLGNASPVSLRRKKERSNFQKLKKDYSSSIQQSEDKVNLLLNKVENELNGLVVGFKDQESSLSMDFNVWFESLKISTQEFQTEKNERLNELETTYQEKLKLEKPAQYWLDRGSKMQVQAWWAFASLLALVGIASYLLYQILWQAPEEIFASFFGKDKSAAIRWSIIFIALLSFIAYAIRSVAKVMFSSFHLARDAQERHTLTFFYLSLLKDSNVGQEDRKLIMQSLFSRSDTGLLKEDSGPTMPTDNLTKFTGKS